MPEETKTPAQECSLRRAGQSAQNGSRGLRSREPMQSGRVLTRESALADIVRPDGRGPRAEGQTEELILPDFDVVTQTGRFWAEVKYKTAASFTILTQRDEHGIGLSLWRHYLAVQQRTQCPVWLFIIEARQGLLLSQCLDTLQASQPRYYRGDKQDRGGMIFFDRRVFVQDIDIPSPPFPPPQGGPTTPETGRPRLQRRLGW